MSLWSARKLSMDVCATDRSLGVPDRVECFSVSMTKRRSAEMRRMSGAMDSGGASLSVQNSVRHESRHFLSVDKHTVH